MKAFKIIDLAGQLGISVYALVSIFLKDDFGVFMSWLFLIGGWQIASFFVHLFLMLHFPLAGFRMFYGLALILCIGLACIPFIGWFILLYLGPAMAVGYFGLGIYELVGLYKKKNNLTRIG